MVTRANFAEIYPNKCCLPRAVLNDFSPVLRVDGSDGAFFVSNDAQCAQPIPAAAYPAMFEYIRVCAGSPSGGGTAPNQNADGSGINGAVRSVTSAVPTRGRRWFGGGWGGR